jgi:hypothetical protein
MIYIPNLGINRHHILPFKRANSFTFRIFNIFWEIVVNNQQIQGNLENVQLARNYLPMTPADFIYHRQRYSGKVQPQNMVFNANLQEFAQRVGYISVLETAGKMAPEDSYRRIEELWQELKRSKKKLGIGEDPFAID